MNEKKDILISVIVPAYNLEDYIERCLKSILNQSYTNLEIIVVDDGSKDNTLRVVEKLKNKDSRIKVISKINEGVTLARLEGLKIAVGEWIGFVDGDDEIESNMYERLLDNALKFSADISHCGYKMIYPNGKVDYVYNSKKIVEQSNEKGLIDLVSGEYIEPGLCNKLFRKKLFKSLFEIDWKQMDIRIYEDLLMNYYLFKNSEKSIYEDFCPYKYILRKGSASKKEINEHKLKDPMKVIKICMCEENNLEIINLLKVRWVREMINISILSAKGQKNLISSYRNTIRRELRKNIFEILKGNYCNKKLKCMALWVSLLPSSYCLFHNFYLKVTGLDKKYNVD